MSVTLTSRLGLIKPTPGSTEPYDIAQANANMDKLDSVAGATQCTSTLRPANPFEGQLIYETDTTMLYLRVSGVWQYLMRVGGYSTYTPVWGSTGTQPTLNNGTITGRWSRIVDSVSVEMAFVYGSTSVSGTGTWTFTMPVAAASLNFMGVGMLRDTAAGRFPGIIRPASASTFTIVGASGADANATVPFTWNAGDEVRASFTYEV